MSKTKNFKKRPLGCPPAKNRTLKYKQKRNRKNNLPPVFCNLQRTVVNDIKLRVNSFQIVASPNIRCSNYADTRALQSRDDTMHKNVSRDLPRHETIEQRTNTDIPNVAITFDRTLELRRKRFSTTSKTYSKTVTNEFVSEHHDILEDNANTSSHNFVVRNPIADSQLPQNSVGSSIQDSSCENWTITPYQCAISETVCGTSESDKNLQKPGDVIIIDDSSTEACQLDNTPSQDQSVIELLDASGEDLCEADKEQSKNDDVISIADSSCWDEIEILTNVGSEQSKNNCGEQQQTDTSIIFIDDDQKVTKTKKKKRPRRKRSFQKQANEIQVKKHCITSFERNNLPAPNVVENAILPNPPNITWEAIVSAQKMLQQVYSVTNTLVQQTSVINSQLDNLVNQSSTGPAAPGNITVTQHVNPSLFNMPIYTEGNMALLFGSNYYNAGQIRKEGLRVVIIDGSNVAMG